MAFGTVEELLPLLLPIAVYWIGSGFYAILMWSMEKNRLFTDDEESAKNLVTRRQVVARVLINQALQSAVLALGVFLQGAEGSKGSGVRSGHAGAGDMRPPLSTSLLKLAGQLATAVLIFDAWQYWWHRLGHESQFLYKHIHSVHHHLVVPYSYGAQYIHPLDSVFGDSAGGAVATLVSGMSPTTSAVFFAFVIVKALDDHSGLWFPGSPISRFLTSNSAMHAFHHQPHGIKYNYCNFLFPTWDKLLGTYKPCYVEEREEGTGYVLRSGAAAKDN